MYSILVDINAKYSVLRRRFLFCMCNEKVHTVIQMSSNVTCSCVIREGNILNVENLRKSF
jgi:hypothetical protein